MNTIKTQGLKLPKLGLGTFRLQGDECRAAVESALALGYRHIDTAEMYKNEEVVGAAIADSGVPRAEIHLTTKVWHTNLAPAAIHTAIEASLAKLKTNYVDLFLVHWPAREMDLASIFQTMIDIRDSGQTRAIGVANFTLPELRKVVEELRAPIACNQIEYHVLLDQTPIRDYLKKFTIPVVAYSPLAQGNLAHQPELAVIAKKYSATPSQVALSWLLGQDEVAAIPKSRRPETQRENLEALNLHLDDADRRAIAALPKDQRFVNPSFAPVWDKPALG